MLPPAQITKDNIIFYNFTIMQRTHILISSHQIKKVTEDNLLGVKIQKSHVTDLYKRVMKKAGFIGQIAKSLSKDILKVILYVTV